jgi:hypothetical protein
MTNIATMKDLEKFVASNPGRRFRVISRNGLWTQAVYEFSNVVKGRYEAVLTSGKLCAYYRKLITADLKAFKVTIELID